MENSPLSKIPPELRNQIYELVFTYPDSIKCLVEGSRSGGSGTICKAYFRVRYPLAMTETCKAIHNESSQLVFSCNTIEICRTDVVDTRYLNDFHLDIGTVSSAIGCKNARLVKAIVLETDIVFMDGTLLAGDEFEFKDELLQLCRAAKLSSTYFPQSRMSLQIELCIAASEGNTFGPNSEYLEQAATGKRLKSEEGTTSRLHSEEARDIAAILRRTGMRLNSHKLEFSGAMEEELRT
ncbi:hypothetical protein LTR10_007729 [Elasticomyces elasticus]|nr:hypothetical protein LTR10_007729 [Elasticomyces elasticus]KAK4970730.1 hypothetical protein LTR42_007706 [Elasticomyces elasticus]